MPFSTQDNIYERISMISPITKNTIITPAQIEETNAKSGTYFFIAVIIN